MTIKIIYALLILLMSLACCSCDKVSRQATPKLSGGHEDNAPSCPKLCSGDPKVISYYLESNTPSDPLQTSETKSFYIPPTRAPLQTSETKSFYIPPTRAPLQTSETKSLHLTKTRAPLEICNHDLNIDIPEYEDPEVARVDSIEDVLRYSHISHRMREEIRRIFGKDSLFTEDEKMSYLLSHDYRWSQLVCILVQMEEDDNISTPLYQHLRQRVYQQDPFIDMI